MITLILFASPRKTFEANKTKGANNDWRDLEAPIEYQAAKREKDPMPPLPGFKNAPAFKEAFRPGGNG
jgi:hypothetical protein